MTNSSRPTWFVGASGPSWGGQDRTEQFIRDGIWENLSTDSHPDRVREVQPGDRIALKVMYVRKTNLPFDARGHSTAVMAIKAIGVVTANAGDGRKLFVNWEPVSPPRQWYFFTYMGTIWKVTPGERMRDALIAFTFDGQQQDYDFFRNSPFWSARYGDARAWLVRPGQDGQPLVDRWLDEGFVSLAASYLRPMDAGATKDEVQAEVQEDYEHVEYPQRRALAEDYYAFLTTMSEGDALVARHDERAWVGRITGEPTFTDDIPRLRRAVEWLANEVPTAALPPEASAMPGSARLVTDLTQVRDAIEGLFDQDTSAPVSAPLLLPGATDELASQVHMPKEWLDEYIGLLQSRRQLIVYGPPGTGKTFVARKVARHVAGDDRLSVVRGRIRISDQIVRHQGIPVPLEVRYSDFSSDTAENRILRAGLRRMAGVERLPGAIARNLRHLEGRLSAVSLLTPGAARPAWTPSRLNERYVPALSLAELILDAIGLTTAEGDQPMASFVVDMAKAFEAFVGTALREALATVSTGLTQEQFPTYLTNDTRFVVRPDVVHLIDGRARAVYDAKYKLAEKPDDIYQMHSYCTILGLKTGHLVYAGSRFADAADAVIRNAGITVRIHPLDVTASPARLLEQVARIAVGSVGTGVRAPEPAL